MGKLKDISPEDLKREYLEKDVSMTQACAALGCCPTTLINALRRYKLPTKPRTWNRRRKNRFPELQDRSWLEEQMKTKSLKQIGAELGTSQGNVSDHAKRHGIRQEFALQSEATVAGLRKRFPNGRFGSSASHWKGGKFITSGGHVYSHSPNHPAANKQGYVMEHRLVAENTLGRPIEPSEVVHHKNGIKTDNRPENLEVLSISEHRREHMDAFVKLHEAKERVAYLEELLQKHNIDF